MKILRQIRDFLYEKDMDNLDHNSAERLLLHKAMLERKPILKNVFCEFHREMKRLERLYSKAEQGLEIEIGAGVFPLKNSYPQILATDILSADHLDRVLDAQKMDVESASLQAIYAQNCFHHFPDPAAFFSELERALTKGGVAVLIEPYFGFVANIFYKNLFVSEDFDKKADWKIDAHAKPNQALSYITFERDRKIFSEKFPHLEIVYQKPLSNYLRYLLSGGLNFKQLIPNFMEPLVKLLEYLLIPLCRVLALHHIIVLRRR